MHTSNAACFRAGYPHDFFRASPGYVFFPTHLNLMYGAPPFAILKFLLVNMQQEKCFAPILEPIVKLLF